MIEEQINKACFRGGNRSNVRSAITARVQMQIKPTETDSPSGAAPFLSSEQLAALRQYDSCTLANAIETFEIRLRNEGYTGPGLQCLSGDIAPLIGYAVTGRVRSANPPISGSTHYYDRTDWWMQAQNYPAPWISVLQDVDPYPGTGAVCGEIHSAILQRLGCIALVTNGAVRDLPAVRRLGFPLFASHVAVSHAYTHLIDLGEPVTICGLEVHPGDLLCADCHGVLSIPRQIAMDLPAIAARLKAHERRVVDLCRSPDFSLDRLKAEVQLLS